MRKKCKMCRSPLNNERCDYCGADHDLNRQASSKSVDTFNYDIPQNDVPGFDVPNSRMQSSHSQQKTVSGGVTAILIGIAILVVIVCGVLFFNGGTGDSLEESTLLGTWGDGEGLIQLLVFQRADSVEFLENGVVIINQGGSRWSANWESDASGTFSADGEQFSYSIDGDILVITDSWNDEWTFNRTASVATDHISSDTPLSKEDVVGTWDWDFDDDFIYAFNVDGTAIRGYSDLRFDFNWELVDDNTIVMDFGSHNEHWEAIIENDTLTLTDLDGYQIWQYVRMSDAADTTVTVTESALLGSWVDGWGSVFLWVFGEAETVEFLENGTLIITEHGISEEVSWRPGALGAFSAGGHPFSYSINGNTLVITDSAGDEWTLERSTD